jgi:hypothetical protein
MIIIINSEKGSDIGSISGVDCTFLEKSPILGCGSTAADPTDSSAASVSNIASTKINNRHMEPLQEEFWNFYTLQSPCRLTWSTMPMWVVVSAI